VSLWGGYATLAEPRPESKMASPDENVFTPFTQRRPWTPGLLRDPGRLMRRLGAAGSPIIEGTTVTFVCYGPRARQVAITGELNDWGRTGVALPMSPLGRTGIFYRTVELDGPARLEYKLVVDGRVISDPLNRNSVDSGIGGSNSCFVVGEFRDPPELARVPSVPHGKVEQFTLESRLLDNRRAVHIYVPPGYDGDSARRFPTLYVHDGGQYLNRAHLPNVLDNLIAARRGPAANRGDGRSGQSRERIPRQRELRGVRRIGTACLHR
jgi:hypothetical protein